MLGAIATQTHIADRVEHHTYDDHRIRCGDWDPLIVLLGQAFGLRRNEQSDDQDSERLSPRRIPPILASRLTRRSLTISCTAPYFFVVISCGISRVYAL